MRKIYDPNTGADVTSSAQATWIASRTRVAVNLFRLQTFDFWDYNPYGDYGEFLFTDADFPVFVNKYQAGPSNVAQLGVWFHGGLQATGVTFLPESMKLGKLEYGIGFRIILSKSDGCTTTPKTMA